MVTIHIDGNSYQVQEGINLLEACQQLGLELPYFCWHPALGSVGSCRQCAVTLFKSAKDTQGRLVMACMTQVAEGQYLAIKDPKAVQQRALLIEATMTNHPHDCPVCEEGGECHLQDMTLLSGHIDRRYRGPKRTHNNQYLGAFINHEMNRCISCYRCVRFYRDYSGGTDLNVFASRNNVYFGRVEDGHLESEFSGNLVEVCPTGVFTDKTFSEHFCRKWDLQSAPSVCVHCSVGCNIHPGERNGLLRRITNRFHPDVNGHFLCDRGRFGYGFVNDPQRTTQPWQRNKTLNKTDRLSPQQAQKVLQELVNTTRESVLAVGSSRSSLENNFALREWVGADHFFSDCNQTEQQQFNDLIRHYQQTPYQQGPYHQGQASNTSLKSLEAADAALLIGEDITQTAPRVALSLRQMTNNAGKVKAAGLGVQYWSATEVKTIAQDLKSPLHIISSHGTRLDDVAASLTRETPSQQTALLRQITELLLDVEPAPTDALGQLAKRIADDLRQAHKPFIITGANMDDAALLLATLQLSQTLHELNPESGLICALPQANSLGLALLTHEQNHLDALFERLTKAPPQTLIILETDLYRACASSKLEALLDQVKNIIVLDHLLTPTAELADLLLPTTSFAEYHGSWVNYEGRLQAAFACYPPAEGRRPAHQWLSSGTPFHTLIRDLAGEFGGLNDLPTLYPDQPEVFGIARKTVRESGRTAIHAAIEVRELPPDRDADSPYQYSQEGVASHLSKTPRLSHTAPAYFWAPGWNSNESVGHFQDEVNGPVRGSHTGLLVFASAYPQTRSCAQSGIGTQIQTGIQTRTDTQILPYHHIFTDEETSARVPAIQKHAPTPSIKLNAKQAQLLGLAPGALITLAEAPLPCALPLKIDDTVADGLALMPAPLLRQLNLPAGTWITLSTQTSKQTSKQTSEQTYE